LGPVINAAQKYLDEKNAYPNFNLGLLGLLLLFKKFAPHTWRNKIVYQFALLVSYELMILVRNCKYAGKHPMSCFQFVAQCFTDAGENYDLKFDNMVITFGSVTQKTKALQQSNTNDGISPIEMLEKMDTNSMLVLNTVSDYNIDNIAITDEEKFALTSKFIATVNEIKNTVDSEPEIQLSVFNQTMANIVLLIYKLQTGKTAANAKEAIDYLKTSTAINFFVSPQDLLVNCPASLEYIGNLSY
jgi:hypothetical protein